MSQLGTGSRLNNDKTRHDLLEPFAINEVAKVFTKGQVKYPKPPHNWLHGMAWSKCLASLERHINAWKRGEDFDFDPNCEACKNGDCTNHTGLYHMAHAAWNALALVSYYKWFPQGDDRMHVVIPKPKIGLDIDEVICEFTGSWVEYWGINEPTAWYFDYNMVQRFEQLKKDDLLDFFYLNLLPKCKPSDLPFEPHCYVTSRPVDTELTKRWLEIHGFPLRPVITVPTGASKVQVLKEAGVDIFFDDRYENFEELNRNGICCFLFDGPHNQRYNVGFKRVLSFQDYKNRFL